MYNANQEVDNENAETTPPFTSVPNLRPISAVLYQHNERLRASYAWQKKVGETLVKIASLMSQQEQEIKNSFTSSSSDQPKP